MPALTRFAVLLFCAFISFGPLHAAQWANSYGGISGEGATTVLQTADGGYIVGGATGSFGYGGTAGWVFRLDPSGNVSWQKTYAGDYNVYLLSMRPTTDGGYIAAGWTDSFGSGGRDAWVVKLDVSGNVIWQAAYGSTGLDFANSVQPTPDGGYVIAGATDSFGAGGYDVWVVKLARDGHVIWQRTYGGTGFEVANAIRTTTDGGYIVVGYTDSFGAGGLDAWVLKLDSNGNVQWQKTYGSGFHDIATAATPTGDGGYIVVGTMRTLGLGTGSGDPWVFKLDGSGNVTWQRTYGGPYDGSIADVQATADGGYVVAGTWNPRSGSAGDAWAFRLDAAGSVLWQRTYGGTRDDVALSIALTADDGYVIAGGTNSFSTGLGDVWVLKLDGNGSIPGCAVIKATSVDGSIGTAVSKDSTAVTSPSTAKSVNSNAIVATSAAKAQQQCYFVTPVMTDIPTLSEWGMALLSGALGL